MYVTKKETELEPKLSNILSLDVKFQSLKFSKLHGDE